MGLATDVHENDNLAIGGDFSANNLEAASSSEIRQYRRKRSP
jgi:hypothetical protein